MNVSSEHNMQLRSCLPIQRDKENFRLAKQLFRAAIFFLFGKHKHLLNTTYFAQHKILLLSKRGFPAN